MPVPPQLPAVDEHVEIWFDGYDEYYPGRVTSLSGPFEFNVLLDDGTDWTIDSRKHVFKLAATESPHDDPQPPKKTPSRPKAPVKKKDPTTPKSVSADDQPEKDTPNRRRAGKALRKNATPSKPTNSPNADQPDEQSDAVDKDQYDPKNDENEVEEEMPRLRRRSARVADEERERERRSTRSRAKPIEEQVGLLRRTRKRNLPRRQQEEEEEDRPSKRLSRVDQGAEQSEDDEPHNDATMSRLSTKAVTAIAVDAALESAKAVLKPLNDRMTSIVAEFAEMNKIMRHAADTAARDAVKKLVGKSENGGGTLAALANFQLDIAEIVGGGEARMKAYSNLSDEEFEHLHKLIEYQGKALKELERLLFAAKEFGNKNAKPAIEPPPPNSNDKEKVDTSA